MKNLANNQEKDKFLYDNLDNKGILVGDMDQGKVSMYVSMTLNEQLMPETKQDLKSMKYLCEKYGEDFCCFGQFTYDIQGGEKFTNKEIAHQLNKMGFIDDKGLPVLQNLRFLEKVSQVSFVIFYSIFFVFQVDVNGTEMHDLFRFLKRHTPDLFIPRYGMAAHIYDFRTKWLCDRYGVVKKYYGPLTELAVIERDVKELIAEPYEAAKY